jgi:hypothetical protein
MGVKYRLSFCNEDETPLRLDIEDSSYSGAILPIEGGANPFLLSMLNNGEFAKLGTIRATEAQMEIFSSDIFNIDLLADNSETKLKVNFYFNDILEWTGFIMPEFYQETINKDKILNITATDRLGILKDVPFPENYQNISLLDIVKNCLLKTGLSLNIVTLIGYNAVGKSLDNRPLEVQVIGERIFNQNGDVLNCYDVLMSVLDTFNCFITQFRGKWHIINKQQLETGLGRLIEYNPTILNNTIVSNTEFSRSVYNLDKVYSGGERILRPVLSDVGILGEFGGSVLYPKNNNFRNWTGSAFSDWTSYNGFAQGVYYDNPVSYNGTTGKINAFLPGLTNKLNNNNNIPSLETNINFNTQRYLQSSPVNVVVDNIKDSKVEIKYSFNIITKNNTFAIFAIILETPTTGDKYYSLNGSNGLFVKAGSSLANLDFDTTSSGPFGVGGTYYQIYRGKARLITSLVQNTDLPNNELMQTTIEGTGIITGDNTDNFNGCKLYVRIYNVALKTANSSVQSIITNVSLDVTSSNSLPKGNLYRATRNGNFTAKAEIKTSVFSDYLARGLNGYFYSYPSDDSSIIQTNAFWTTNYDSNVLPILQHSVRQISRLYANVQSDYLVTIREPRLSILDLMSIACKSQSFVVTNYTIDYLRSQINLTASQITSATNPDSEFIYSYFGDEGGTNVSGLSSIGGGGAGGGGGSPQDLQQTLDRGNVGDKMIIEDLMVIPLQSPDLADMQQGAIWVGDSGVNPSTISGGQNLEDTLAQGNTAYNNGILLGGIGSGYGYKLRNGAEMYGHSSLQIMYLLASDGYYLVSFTPSTKQMLVVNPDSSISYEAIPSGGGGGSQNLDSVLAQGNSSGTYGILLSGIGYGKGYRNRGGSEMYGGASGERMYLRANDGYYLVSFTPSIKQMLVINPDSSITYEAIPSGGGGGSTAWGGISGTLSNQADLQSALNNKQNTLTAGTGISIIGNVISSTGGGGGGGVSSVGLTAPTGFTVSNSPITSSGNIALYFASGYSLPTTTKQSEWDTAYTQRHTHSNKTALDSISGADIINWNNAYLDRHTHSNKANLDTINQNMGTSNSVSFTGVTATSTIRIPTVAPSSPVNGNIWVGTGVAPQPIDGTFAGLTDTNIVSPSNGQVPVFNSTNNKWENKTVSGGGGVNGILNATSSISIDADSAGYYIEVNVTSGVNCTLLPAIALTSTFIEQSNSGKITFVAGSGVTLRKESSKTGRTKAQYNVVEIFYKTATEAIIKGDYE